MKNMKQLYPAVICSLAAAIGTAAFVLWRKKNKNQVISPEQNFVDIWSSLLRTDAKVYVGLFSSLCRVAEGSAKKPEKVLKEWSSRTCFRWEDSAAASLCYETLEPAVENADSEECAKWAELLLQAAAEADIVPERETEIVLNDTTVLAYDEWDGAEIYPGDTVKVMFPAWYQNRLVLERGRCTVNASEDATQE